MLPLLLLAGGSVALAALSVSNWLSAGKQDSHLPATVCSSAALQTGEIFAKGLPRPANHLPVAPARRNATHAHVRSPSAANLTPVAPQQRIAPVVPRGYPIALPTISPEIGFILGEQYPVYESQTVELKAGQGKDCQTEGFLDWSYSSDMGLTTNYSGPSQAPGLLEIIERYASAFANTKGGQLLFGVDDDGEVLGVHCDRKRYDRLCLAFDAIAKRHIFPSLDPEYYAIDLKPVWKRTSAGLEPTNKVILVVTIRQPTIRHLYHSSFFGYVVRGAASVQQMTDLMVQDRLAQDPQLPPIVHQHRLPAPGKRATSGKSAAPSKGGTRQHAASNLAPVRKSKNRTTRVLDSAPTPLVFPSTISEYQATTSRRE